MNICAIASAVHPIKTDWSTVYGGSGGIYISSRGLDRRQVYQRRACLQADDQLQDQGGHSNQDQRGQKTKER